MKSPAARAQVRSLLLAGILPVIAFSVIEDQFGTLWGLVAGMVFGVGEIIYEAATQGRVDPLTWGGNGLLLLLGGVSLLTDEGIWFKLQPSIIEALMALVLWGSVVLKKPLLEGALKKQLALQLRASQPGAAVGPGTGTYSGPQSAPGPALKSVQPPIEIAPILSKALRAMTARVGLFFALHAALAAWAAMYWSTAAWAALKGFGFTVTMIVYVVAESLFLRYKIAQRKWTNST